MSKMSQPFVESEGLPSPSKRLSTGGLLSVGLNISCAIGELICGLWTEEPDYQR